jgi:outer membrane protein OmpA-like peptidoglycan-associated protein
MDADIELSKIVLKGGKVDYTDNFIKPNYTANLSDMEGKVSAFGTKSTSPANVSLDGKINGSSPINIDGSINPLAPTAFVDIKAKANGIELTGLSPYTTKYTGFPIVKGTLTVDVHYLLDTGKLTAENHIFIDQLTFGDHVESPDATNLPIRLAVSLLKNSKGQIDLRIPVSGSLSDPQFSIGSIILGAFMNLIIKAATSPFTLLAAAFGGNGEQQDLGYIEFAPGYVTLTPESQQKLDTVAKALADRTALKLNISGRADPKFDKDGYREASLEHSIEELSRKDKGDSASADGKPAALSKEDYNKYLSKVYSAGKFQKPRDVIGLAKTQPPDEMKKLILTNTPVSDEDLQHLADWRAQAVRAYLSSKQVDSSRMFIVAPKLDASGIKDQGKTTRVDLSLQ